MTSTYDADELRKAIFQDLSQSQTLHNYNDGANVLIDVWSDELFDFITSRDQQIALAATAEAASKVFIDIPTGHQITRLTGGHQEKCSSTQGFMCDCSILKAAQYAVDKAKDRIETTLTQAQEGGV